MNKFAVSAVAIAALAGAASAQVLVDTSTGLATGATTHAQGLPAPAGTQWSEVGYLTTTPETPGNSAGARNSGGLLDRTADDFVIPTGETWNITQISFFGYQTGGVATTSSFTGATVQIWDGVPGAVGSNIVFGDSTTNRLSGSTFANLYRSFSSYAVVNGFTCSGTNTTRPIFRNDCAVSTTLGAGTYWIDWNMSGSLASGPWAPSVFLNPAGPTSFSEAGSNGMQFTTANGVWIGVTEVGLITPCSAGFAADPMPFPFIVSGTMSGGGCEPDLTTGAIAGQPGYGVPNGVLNNDDFFYYLAIFAAGC